MIKAELVLDQGLLRSCVIRGHAGAGPKGADIVCAAVSVLARTALKTLSDRLEAVNAEFPERGEFFLEIPGAIESDKEFISGVGTFLTEGLLSVSREYPDFCKVSIEELQNGS